MSDERTRALKRAAAAGDEEAVTAYRLALCRAGDHAPPLERLLTMERADCQACEGRGTLPSHELNGIYAACRTCMGEGGHWRDRGVVTCPWCGQDVPPGAVFESAPFPRQE